MSMGPAGARNPAPGAVASKAVHAAPEKLKIFISYSRADTAFADELVSGLEFDGGFDVMIDRHAIQEGEAWKDRLGALILAADTIVFVLSPKSAASPICRWEVEEASRKSKRILPVLAQPVGDVPVPEALAALNYVRFDEGRSFMAGLTALRRALKTDLSWLREHTRLLERAQEWDSAGRNENRLLVGSDIAAAKAWLANRPQYAPEPTELHRDFLQASDQADTARRSTERQRAEALQRSVTRTRWALGGALVFALVAVLASVFAWKSQLQAVDAKLTAQAAQLKAETAQKDLSESVLDLQAAEKELSENVAQLKKKEEEVVAYYNQAGKAFRDNAALKFQGIVARHNIAAAGIKIDPAPSLSDAELLNLLNDNAIDTIVNFEIESRQRYERSYSRPEWPSGASGVTIGIGYDLQFATAEAFAADWSDLPADQLQRLSAAVGLRGEAAKALIPQLKDIVIPYDMAVTAFRRSSQLAQSLRMTANAFPKATKLPPDCFSALVSLVYNRGASVSGDKRAEMFAISRLIQLEEYHAVPEQFRAMAWIWDRNLKGLPQRRADEAKLFEKGLAEMAAAHP